MTIIFVEFWKSTRKTLATSKQNFLGKPPAACALVDLTTEPSTHGPPAKKQKLPVTNEADHTEKLDQVMTKLNGMKALDSLLQLFLQFFQCVICKDTVTIPMLSPCCGCIAGCQCCVE